MTTKQISGIVQDGKTFVNADELLQFLHAKHGDAYWKDGATTLSMIIKAIDDIKALVAGTNVK